MAVIEDYDAVFGEQEAEEGGENYVTFNDDIVSDEQTETDVKQLEGKHNMTLQQMKEHVIGTVSNNLPHSKQHSDFKNFNYNIHLARDGLEWSIYADIMPNYFVCL